nr:MAG TPA: hypothetical protein [Caudoviricetes sp.]
MFDFYCISFYPFCQHPRKQLPENFHNSAPKTILRHKKYPEALAFS